ncbi:MAG: ribosomal-processing cysteine protease Prp [Erysipelotrichaceae bacterium]|nr:ribosomal-processing cysteine protease Prp [Erysipelotrichaceae bacterium]
MIQISVYTHEGMIREIRVTGHSGSAEKGKDLICAGVSAITFGLCNALDILTDVQDIEVNGNRIVIRTDDTSEKVQTILQTGVVQLETIQETAEQFIQMKKTEV